MNSIRGRLLVWQISALMLTALLVSLITYSLAWNAFNRVRDFGLEQIALMVLRHGVEIEEGEAQPDGGQYLSQIWEADGTLAYTSDASIQLPPQPDGLNTVRLGRTLWHTYTMRKGGLTIQVANTEANRRAMFARILPWLILPSLVLIAGLGALIWLAVGRALRPLDALRQEIGVRAAPSLHAVQTVGLPEEVRPLALALNDLLARLEAALEQQRRFIADAAHELRTPLAAVRLQAQVLGQAQDEAARHYALAQLIAGVDRASHLVQQLLDLARLSPEANREAVAEVALDELLKAVVAEFSAQAEAAGIDLGLGRCDSVRVAGRARALRMLVSNLVDNALRHCPTGSRVDVELHRGEGVARLAVCDNGPGIPAAERTRVFDRFYRLPSAAASGSGLGLAIVQDIVRLHGGRVWLDDTAGGGLTVWVELPLHERTPAGPSVPG
ncbi:MAG: ATP-binding protein [Thiobacillaceae bacterium]|nr:ATP-binding protein [Thiobacillaceae bacterium]MDW8324854.1 ATP-binding protein [Burkholderiales bacterium]